ncbi:hypothetical protein QU39_00195, partial [Staphylococcus aureus]
ALERPLDEGRGDAVLLEEFSGLVEILLVANLERHAVAGRGLRLAQHQRVVLMLFAAAQVDGFAVGVLDMQADGVLVERAGGREIGHVQHDVAAAQHVEWRLERMLGNGHGRVSSCLKGCQSIGRRAAGSCACPAQGWRAWFPCRT